MKIILLRILSGLIDFYFLSYFVGIAMMIITMFSGSLSPSFVFTTMGISIIAVLLYHLFNQRFTFLSPGETMVGMTDDRNKRLFNSPFSITRTPVFILCLLTLALTGNLLDGLSQGKIYGPVNILNFSLISGCFYYGMKNFFIRPQLIAILLISMGLLLTAMTFHISVPHIEAKTIMRNLFVAIAGVWILIGWIYLRHKKKEMNVA